MELPVYWNYNMVANSVIQPSTIRIRDTELHRFFVRYLLQDAMSVFKWNFPINWDLFENYFLYTTYCIGYLTVFETDKYGVIPQICGLGGYGICLQPKKCIVSNPLIRNTLELEIDKNCVLFRLQPDYCGIMDIVNYYADMLALSAEAAGINLLNTHVAYMFGAANKNAAESIKKLYDRVAQGEPLVVADKSLCDDEGELNLQLFQNDVSKTYIVDKLLLDMEKLTNMFRTSIGLNNANTEKKERLITDEVNANNEATYSKVELWLDTLQKSCKKVKNMFGVDISVDWRNRKEIHNNESDSYTNGNVSN